MALGVVCYTVMNNQNSMSLNPLLCIILSFVMCAQLCLTLCDPMDCSLPGFSVHGILQARTLERVAKQTSKNTLHEI